MRVSKSKDDLGIRGQSCNIISFGSKRRINFKFDLDGLEIFKVYSSEHEIILDDGKLKDINGQSRNFKVMHSKVTSYWGPNMTSN